MANLTTTEQLIINRLGTKTRRAMRKTHKKWGHKYFYQPRGDLLKNISEEFNISIDQAYLSLMNIRAYYTNHLSE